ncbi:hypothetical protein FS749_003933 [Ceratobasidium sp. UAMH 11750]|nr:hypothetical protein FS749_003933 [Ceratobasidium sp. UAMH 11750]
MSRQDRQVTERHTRTLRELVKRPENKVCADCKKNDPRWASWNIGVFICIRCSGIHRSMGTHISKVKSVDLDVWTPEQMASIQKWGNERANLYWEAHLKAGHQPPDHKIESFIRSKYESRRWAMEGPPPSDPSVLGGGSAPAPEPVSQPEPVSSPTLPAPQITSRPTQHNLLSTSLASRTAQPAAPQASQPQALVAAPTAPAAPAAPQNDLFSLDFHAPTPPVQPQAPKNAKSDILSLYSAGSTAGSGAFGGFGQQPAQAPGMPQTTSMAGTTGTGMWGVQSGWAPPAQAQPAANDIWGSFGSAPQQPVTQSNSLFGAQNVWGNQALKPAAPAADSFGGNVWGGSTAGTAATGGNDLFSQPFSAAPAKKDDAFGDLWGGFKRSGGGDVL